jgi:hypothetical protein
MRHKQAEQILLSPCEEKVMLQKAKESPVKLKVAIWVTNDSLQQLIYCVFKNMLSRQ